MDRRSWPVIQIALFSAILATFLVQSLTGLSQDPGDRTNELLANLTNIIIALNNANVSNLNIDPPTPFTPESSAIRLNFYWSISLVLSVSNATPQLNRTLIKIVCSQICVAALAVTSRGYVATLTRSHHTQAYKKLGELHSRWGEANWLLAPAVELLPQLLIIPVILFVIGLLDNMLSVSVPLSKPTSPIFVAGVPSCGCTLVVCTYTLWTVAHGYLHPAQSPFQSTISRFLAKSPAFAITIHAGIRALINALFFLLKIWSLLHHYLRSLISTLTNAELGAPLQASSLPESSKEVDIWRTLPSATFVTRKEYEAFYFAVMQTHEDYILDEAVAALYDLRERWYPGGHSPQHLLPSPHIPHHFEARALFHLLSSEASISSNLAAASYIASYLLFRPNNTWRDLGKYRFSHILAC